MRSKSWKSIIQNFVLITTLLIGLSGTRSAQAGSEAILQVNISTPSYPVGIDSGESKSVPYRFTETGNVSGEITSRTYRFYTQYDDPLSDALGPYPTSIKVNALQSNTWDEPVYLPASVAEQARSMNKYALVLKTTFAGKSASGADFNVQASLLLLLPPAAFNKMTPVDGGSVLATSPVLQWHGSVGAIDYEYCFDTIDNNSCDTTWTGTYWLSTYNTNVALQNLPPNTTFYWQVRANNMAGTTYANNGKWWSMHTREASDLVVTNLKDKGPGSLRDAIASAANGETITFDPSLVGGTIALSTTLVIDKNLTIDGSMLSSPIIINGSDSVTVFQVKSGVKVTMDSLTTTNGNAVWGSGISNDGTLTLRNSVVSNNSASYNGGGIANSGNLTVLNSTVSNNSAGSDGGGIHNDGGILVIRNSELSGNAASYGGGIYTRQGTVTITDDVFSENTATTVGGGIYNFGTLTVSNSTFYKNDGASYGGGIYHSYIDVATITSSTFLENSASSGGGIYNDASTLNVANSTFAGNVAGSGGGIFNNGNFVGTAILILKNSTLSGNLATSYGSGVYNLGTMNYINTIIANSTAGFDCYNNNGDTGTINVNINNLVETNGPAGHTCGTPSVTSDPMLAPLADNGGATQTMALDVTSPAFNAGDNANCPAIDQRGVKRPQGTRCDIGAYEYADTTPPTVTGSQLVDDNPTSAASLNFMVTFSEPVTGVDIKDFMLTATGVTGAAVMNVSGSGATYTITVKTGSVGSFNGTIRLNVVDNDSIRDIMNNPLGGSGTGNGNFNTGQSYTIAAHVARPIYLSPRANYITSNALPAFTWGGVTDALHYEIQIDTDPNFTANADSYLVDSPAFTPETPLANGEYYWHVRAYNILEEYGGWSALRSFTIDTVGPQTPTLRSPLNGASLRNVPTFRWSVVNDAVLYQFQLDNDADFSSPLISVEQRTTIRKPSGGLRGTYSWRVRARDAAGNWSEWSPAFTITIVRSR